MHAMANPSATRRPTYADIEALPPGRNGEILAGELVVSPRPAPKHAYANSALMMLMHPLMLDGDWWILHEPELSLGIDADFDPVIPDLGGWRRARMPALPETAPFHTTPDWVCETLSPGTARHDRALKLPFYGRAGVGHAWIVDPLARMIEVFVLEHGRWVVQQVASESEVVALAPFDELELPLARLWVNPRS